MTPVASWSPADYYVAFSRCRSAWEATSPQLTIDGWADMLDGLDAADAGAFRCVEPVASNNGGRGGLAVGDGERPESPSGPTRPLYTHEGGGALPSKSAPHRQGGPS